MPEPRAWKPALLGAKTVKFGVLEKLAICWLAYSAPWKEVRLKFCVVPVRFVGGMSRESMTCTTPPLKVRSWRN